MAWQLLITSLDRLLEPDERRVEAGSNAATGVLMWLVAIGWLVALGLGLCLIGIALEAVFMNGTIWPETGGRK